MAYSSILRLKPGVQKMEDGSFRPQVLIDAGEGFLRVGDTWPTLKAAHDLACSACEAVGDGEWLDGWYSTQGT